MTTRGEALNQLMNQLHVEQRTHYVEVGNIQATTKHDSPERAIYDAIFFRIKAILPGCTDGTIRIIMTSARALIPVLELMRDLQSLPDEDSEAGDEE